jgi:ribulose-phosphate 3-epimerase
MTSPVRIAPSILAADFANLGDQIQAIEAAGADLIHIDVMDGQFVPPISFGDPLIKAVRGITSLPLDVHLMIVQPERHVERLVSAGADIITVHAEVCPHLNRTIQQIREAGAKPAVALNPHLPAVMVQEVLPLLDMVLVMTVNPGYGGQSFKPESLRKIRQIRQMADDIHPALDIQVDGGITPDTAAQVCAHGANVLVAGTSVFKAEAGIEAAMQALRSAAVCN